MARILLLILLFPMLAYGQHNAINIQTVKSNKGHTLHKTTTPNHAPYYTRGKHQAFSACQNVRFVPINYLLATVDADTGQTLTWTKLDTPTHGSLIIAYSTTSTGASITPSGQIYIPDTGYHGTDSFSVVVSDGQASDTTYVAVTLNPLPVAGPIQGPGGVCMGGSILLTDTVAGGTWSCTNGHALLSAGLVTAVSPGLDTIKYFVTGTQCNNSATKVVSIDTLPTTAGTLNGLKEVCVGAKITLFPSIPNGVWSVSNNHATDTDGVVLGKSAGIDTIIYTIINACGDTSTTFTVTIVLPPNAGTVTGPSSVCVGDSILVADTATNGTWVSSNGHAIVRQTGYVKGESAGTCSITYSVGNACGFVNAGHPMVVNPQPNPGAIIGPAGICIGDTIVLTNNINTGDWQFTNPNISLIPITNGCIIKGLTTGTNTVTYSATNVCGTLLALHPLHINPLPIQPSITKSGNTLSVPSAYTSYQWLRDTITIDGAIHNTYEYTLSGTYTIAITNEFGCSSKASTAPLTGCNPQDLKVYPNPTRHLINILWCQKVKLTLTYMDGKIIKSLPLTDQIDLTPLQSGLYLLNAYDANNMLIKSEVVVKE